MHHKHTLDRRLVSMYSNKIVSIEDWNSARLILIFNAAGKGNPWLASPDDETFESTMLVFLELHATAMLCLPSGECMHPDATICTALMSALYSSVCEEVVLRRQLMVCCFFC